MTTILFLGVQNAARSQMAEAFFNHFAREQGLSLQAISAGIRPGFAVNLQVEDVMNEIGIPMTGQHPKPLTPDITQRATYVISMGPDIDPEVVPATLRSLMSDWGLEEIKGQPVEVARSLRGDIRWKVEDLLADLTRQKAETENEITESDALPAAVVEEPLLVCHLGAFDTEQKGRYDMLLETLMSVVQSRRELPDGYAFVLPSDVATCLQAMEFATLERRCCPFLTFRFDLAPSEGPLTLSLTGPEGIKELLGDFWQKEKAHVIEK